MELSACLKALGDPTRLLIFQQLLLRKHCTRSLSGKLGFTEATISQHLKILFEAGLVCKEKHGYHMHYLPVQEAVDFLAASFDQMRLFSEVLNRDPGDCQCEFRRQMDSQYPDKFAEKEIGSMKIAVTYENGEIFQHFGHTEQFKVYDVENGAVRSAQVIPTGGFGHGALAGFLRDHQVEALICGGIGGGAQAALAEAGIRLYAGCSGDADTAVKALLGGTLTWEANPVCSHHGEHHGSCHGEDHDCGHEEGHCCH